MVWKLCGSVGPLLCNSLKNKVFKRFKYKHYHLHLPKNFITSTFSLTIKNRLNRHLLRNPLRKFLGLENKVMKSFPVGEIAL